MQEGAPGAVCHGPITQQQLLQSLGIEVRLQALLEVAETEEQADSLIKGYQRLVAGTRRQSQADASTQQEHLPDDIEGMGTSYQAMVIAGSGKPTPVAFDQLKQC